MAGKIYATSDADGDRIWLNADIAAFDTLAEAEAWLRRGFDPEDAARIEIVAGTFGDCWIKSMSRPDADTGWLEPFTLDDVRVAAPGSHPGGSRYWTTPWPTVLVAVLKLED